LKFVGIGEGRIRMEYIGTAESEKLSRSFTSFTEEIRAMGPSPFKRKEFARG